MLESLLGEAQRYVNDYGYTAVFLGVFLESFGLPTPGESLMIAGAILAAHGHLSIGWVVLRLLNGIVAGTMGMNWWRFLAYNAAGAALWVGFWAGSAFYFGRRFREIMAWVGTLEPIVVIIAVVATIVVLTYLWRQQRKRKRKRATPRA